MGPTLEYYTPNGTENLLSISGMKLIAGTGLAVGGIYGITQVVATSSKSATEGAVDKLQSQF